MSAAAETPEPEAASGGPGEAPEVEPGCDSPAADGGEAADPGALPADRRGWALLLGSCLVYLLWFAIWQPPTHAIEDEVGFLNSATIWAQGALSAEAAGLEGLSEVARGPRGSVGWRNLGRPLVTAPFLAVGGYAAAFWAGALIHVALALLAGLALRRLGRSPAWALLLLWHPTALLYSRAVMADELGALGCCAAAWLLLGRRYAWAGLALGCAVLARYHLGATALVVAVTCALTCGRGPALRLALGGALPALGLVTYNQLFLGNPLGATGQGHFALRYLGGNLLHYSQALLLVWPGLLLAPILWGLWRLGRRGEHVAPEVDRRMALLGALCLPLTGLLLLYYFHDTRPSRLETLIVGQRLLLPALPAWILIYAQVLSVECPGDVLGEARRRRWLSGAAVGLAILGALGGALIMARHQRYLEDLVEQRDRVAARIPPGELVFANRHLSKLLEVPQEGVPRYRLRTYEFHQRLLDGALQAAAREPSYLVHLRRRAGESDPPAWAALLERVPSEVVFEDERLVIRRAAPRRSE